MKLFKKNKQSIDNDIVANRIANNIMKLQQKLADYLNKKTSSLTAKAWLCILIGFCLTFGCYCTYLLIKSV